ncbi:PEP-CTERM sorting domain-containing protein [Poriferisphaera sp. WC338]|uniref:PEP-CTERM sorting domain-containing protein n=1 Tax=Poriferisphaera sp. WC338 TaxID=3425129 RepID=UPI003D812AE5
MKTACLAALAALILLSLTVTTDAAPVAIGDPYADAVVSYTEGSNVGDNVDDPALAIGGPDGTVTPAAGYVSLGNGGSIILEFTDNALIDGAGDDIRIFEVGNPDTYELSISVDGSNGSWIFIGSASVTASFDIGAATGVSPTAQYRFVKLDDGNAILTPAPVAGLDLDAVEALNSVDIVPEPASVALLSLGSLALIKRRRMC